MKEDYVIFEIAKLLKEKGFPQNPNICNTAYTFNGKLSNNAKSFVHNAAEFDKLGIKPITYSMAPTLQMAMKWIREKGFHIFVPLEIDYDEDESGDKWYHDATYYPEIRRVSDGKIMYDDGALYATPEQAIEVAIKYCLTKLI